MHDFRDAVRFVLFLLVIIILAEVAILLPHILARLGR